MSAHLAIGGIMKIYKTLKILVSAVLCSMIFTSGVFAQTADGEECFIAFKAKKDNPLRLKFKVIRLSGVECRAPNLEDAIQEKINSAGWKLLKVIGEVVQPEDLYEEEGLG